MTKIVYIPKQFKDSSLELINRANRIIADYEAQGFSLTLRQLYYQMVSRNILPNKQTEYKRLGSIINDARLAGLVSWEAIEDRTRNLQKNTHWDSPKQIVDAAVSQYKVDKWDNQPVRVEVWIEKDALAGVIEGVCRRLDVSYFSCRGYTSASEMWRAAMRLQRYFNAGVHPVILHLGDHDPSGIDMTRDIEERLALLSGEEVEVQRIALNMDQINQYDPPPNPTKLTDSRASGYISEFGRSSWELDALEPSVIVGLIERHVGFYLDNDLWEVMEEKESAHKSALRTAAATLKL